MSGSVSSLSLLLLPGEHEGPMEGLVLFAAATVVLALSGESCVGSEG